MSAARGACLCPEETRGRVQAACWSLRGWTLAGSMDGAARDMRQARADIEQGLLCLVTGGLAEPGIRVQRGQTPAGRGLCRETLRMSAGLMGALVGDPRIAASYSRPEMQPLQAALLLELASRPGGDGAPGDQPLDRYVLGRLDWDQRTADGRWKLKTLDDVYAAWTGVLILAGPGDEERARAVSRALLRALQRGSGSLPQEERERRMLIHIQSMEHELKWSVLDEPGEQERAWELLRAAIPPPPENHHPDTERPRQTL